MTLLAVVGCRQDDFAATNIARRPYAGVLSPAKVASGSLTLGTGFQTEGVAGAVNQFFGWSVNDPPVKVATLQQPYTLGFGPFACLAKLQDPNQTEPFACLSGPSYHHSVAPHLIAGTVEPVSVPAWAIDGDVILSTAFENLGIPMSPISGLDMFGSEPITVDLEYSHGVRVELRRRHIPDPDHPGKPIWIDKITGKAEVQSIIGLFATLTAVPNEPSVIGATQSCTCTGSAFSTLGVRMEASIPDLQEACDELAYLCLPYVTGSDPIPDSCDSISWSVSLRRLPINIGFVPERSSRTRPCSAPPGPPRCWPRRDRSRSSLFGWPPRWPRWSPSSATISPVTSPWM